MRLLERILINALPATLAIAAVGYVMGRGLEILLTSDGRITFQGSPSLRIPLTLGTLTFLSLAFLEVIRDASRTEDKPKKSEPSVPPVDAVPAPAAEPPKSAEAAPPAPEQP